ncbi:hypothetical protein SDC9_70753 [bioreactor metagenome]|uniref:GmrSD restriction endonucleases N-terminal domain-containing protein n=1 Tax=bioreactor metagenome TaxID=1076179 RepID=A0A644Y6R3_9ZZZZ
MKNNISGNVELEEIVDEEMSYSDDDLYTINSWGADFSFREILEMYKDGDILKPELQRNYVWTKNEASRFIDSILLGLPIPSVFFAKEPNETMLIVDGYQRIMTVSDYLNGIFSGDKKVFKLSNSENINYRWRGKAFKELTASEQRKIRMTTIHAIIFEQTKPNDNTGMYQIFERINTGGKVLKPQEIRNCVYQGAFNTLLFELNKNKSWRDILQSKAEDARMADLELILRFFAIRDIFVRPESEQKQINLVKYLNKYMSDNKKINDEEAKVKKEIFVNTIKTIYSLLGDNAFKRNKVGTNNFGTKINPAVFDAVASATSYVLDTRENKKQAIPNAELFLENYIKLLNDSEFLDAITKRTTDIKNIKKRVQLSTQYLFGVDHEF